MHFNMSPGHADLVAQGTALGESRVLSWVLRKVETGGSGTEEASGDSRHALFSVV